MNLPLENVSSQLSKRLEVAFQGFIVEKQTYYNQWIYDEPIVVGPEQARESERLQKVMYKLINEFVLNYDDSYSHLMPVSDKVRRILSLFGQKEYKIGTYRTDFVYDSSNTMRIIEITCRYALNAMFFGQYLEHHARTFYTQNAEQLEVEFLNKPIFDHFEQRIGTFDQVCILKGEDQRTESKIYKDVLEHAGLIVHEIQVEDINNHHALLPVSWVVSELSFEEIGALSDQTLQILARSEVINDFRTIFLIHDKRFFSVLGNSELQKACLSEEEIELLLKWYIPTYRFAGNETIWENAYHQKDQWILKPNALGKSIGICAGPVTEEKDWQAQLKQAEKNDEWVLQEWIPQQTISGTINGTLYEDYLVGTLLFFDDNFFGYGDFRTSSFPVTNVVDHRKASNLVLKNEKNLALYAFQNIII